MRPAAFCGMLVALQVLAACAAVEVRESRFYTLAAVELDEASKPLHWVLRIADLEIAPHLVGERLVVREGLSGLGRRRDERWAAPLGSLVTNALGAGLLAASRFRAIVDDRDPSQAELVLEGRVLSFEELRAGEQSKARVVLALALRGADDGKVLLQRRVEASVPLHGNDGRSLVAGLHTALGLAFRNFLETAEETAGAWSAPSH